MGASGPRGLENIGGTCYMNTVLQCFYHVEELSKYLLKEEEKNSNFYDDKPFCKSYLGVVKGLNKRNSSRAFSPKEFLKSLVRVNQGYNYGFGNDPKDVVSDILFQLHQELGIKDMSIQLNKYVDKRKKKQLFDYYKNQEESNKTKISELFNWCRQTKKKCSNCSEEFYDFEYEFMLFFYLEKIYNEQNTKNVKLDLINDCFENTFKKREENITCPYCNKREKGEIDNHICVLPKYFIIILDRGKNDKFDCGVNFGKEINISKFVSQIDNPKYNPKYELLCATFLRGKSGNGHTVAVCKEEDKYYLLNDAWSTELNINYFKNEKPFLLFYKRINY